MCAQTLLKHILYWLTGDTHLRRYAFLLKGGRKTLQVTTGGHKQSQTGFAHNGHLCFHSLNYVSSRTALSLHDCQLWLYILGSVQVNVLW